MSDFASIKIVVYAAYFDLRLNFLYLRTVSVLEKKLLTDGQTGDLYRFCVEL